MDGTCLADKTTAEELEYAIGLDERRQKVCGRVGIIGGMDPVIGKADRGWHLVWGLIYRRRDADAV
jgi:hypothetical protein